MRAGAFFLSLTFFINSFSYGKSFLFNESVVCPENNIVYKGVTCCLDSVTALQCKSYVDALPDFVKEKIDEVQGHFQNKDYKYGKVPNCYWFAATYHGLFEEEKARPITAEDLSELIKSKGLISQETILAHSLLVFDVQGEAKTFIEDKNGMPKVHWQPTRAMVHAAVSLEEGLMVQKEDIGTNIFSLSSVEQSVRAYESVFNKNPTFRKAKAEVTSWLSFEALRVW